MASIAFERITTPVDGSHTLLRWADLTEADEAVPYISGHKADKSVQVIGTFGAGGSVAIEGSNVRDPASNQWDPLRDTFGNLLDALAARSIRQIMEGCYAIRPRVVAGSGVSVSVYLLILQNR